MLTSTQGDALGAALDRLRIELPSWGFANTGTRFGKFIQPAAATTIEEKFADAGEVHRLTGACPTMALHVLWDLPGGLADTARIESLSGAHGVAPGSINPNLFEDQAYKFGSIANPDPEVRARAVNHLSESAVIGDRLGSRDVTVWVSDGSNYPGTQSMRHRKHWCADALRAAHARLAHGQRLLIEYKPFEPAFYHTDVADWGMALLLAREAGPQARVLVDTGHHYQSQNVEQIVAWLLDEGMLGGFHFNDRRYADDDLTLGSIDPFQVFRIFHEIQHYEWESGTHADIAYMVDQSHNLKDKIEAMLQTVRTAQELWAKAALVDHEALARHQAACRLVDAERCLTDAFNTDVRPAVAEWATDRALPADPILAFRQSGYLERITNERRARNLASHASYA
jgi:L-rhamnose isomerase/sugar isomerase